MTQQLRFLIHAPQDAKNMSAELGRADYSYRFVLQYFRPVLAEIGTVVELPDPHDLPDGLPGVTDVLLLFMPPHQIPLDLADRAIPVFAWEYTTIPTEPFGDDPRNDWREVLRRAPGAITHSQFAVTAVREAMGADYPVVSLPAPVWDTYAPLADRGPVNSVELTGAILDTATSDPAVGAMPTPTSGTTSLDFTGPVFTTVVNPYDGRKVWADTITAYVAALREEPDATLVLKLVHHDRDLALAAAWDFMHRLSPYRCRILAVHGYLTDLQFAELIAATTFVVNSSRGEGQCLPLMEFMSAGVPAIAPDHTALADYIDADDAFVVGSWPEWAWWPHDPRRFLRCLRHPVDWDSLRSAFNDAHHAATSDPGTVHAMGVTASQRLGSHCSRETVTVGLRRFLTTEGVVRDR